MKLPNCPHCGNGTGVYVNARATGAAHLYFNDDGTEEEVAYDSLAFIPVTGVVRCDSCMHIRRDLRLDGREIRVR